MPSLVIKKLPPELHRRLKSDAVLHHRSMTQQAIVILERSLATVPPLPPVKAVNLGFPLTNAFINQAKREGRE